MNKRNALVMLALLGAAPLANAGQWSVAIDPKGANKVDVIMSFTGDGQTEEAQLDLKVKRPFSVQASDVMWKGGLCVASAEQGVLRAVPPSGAGTPLVSKKGGDACVFSLTFTDTAKKGGTSDFTSDFEVALAECASSVAGAVACGQEIGQLPASSIK